MPFGLYLHFPFCSKICPYCDFYVLRASEAKRGAFLPYYKKELALLSQKRPGLFTQKLQTLYFGGGTPSLLDSVRLKGLLKTIQDYFTLDPNAEITLEANPNDTMNERPEEFRILGVNRLSIGVQGLNDSELKTLGREHTARQAIEAAQNAHKSGFENFTLDLIFGLPGQTLDSWKQTLDQAVKLQPTHFSTYSLTIEERTPFFKLQEQGKLHLPPDEVCQEMYLTGVEFLEQNGYLQYEISNFARSGFESKHNRNYWQRESYLGIGPSAHSFHGAKRWANVRSLNIYQEKLERGELPLEFEEAIDLKQALEEAIFLGLRQKDGIDLDKFTAEFGYDLEQGKNTLIQKLIAQNYAKLTAEKLQLTPLGLYLSDRIAAELFP